MIGICLRIFILHLALLFCFSGPVFAVMKVDSGPVTAEPGKTQQATERSHDQEIVNVIIDRMENGYLYSKAGQAYEIGRAKVINNSSSTSKVKMAELTFRNGTLAVVVLK